MIVLDTSAIIEFVRGDNLLRSIVESAEKRGDAIGLPSV